MRYVTCHMVIVIRDVKIFTGFLYVTPTTFGMFSVIDYLSWCRQILHLLRNAHSFLAARYLSQNSPYVSRIRIVMKFKQFKLLIICLQMNINSSSKYKLLNFFLRKCLCYGLNRFDDRLRVVKIPITKTFIT